MNHPIETTSNGKTFNHGLVRAERRKWAGDAERDVTVEVDFVLLTEHAESFAKALEELVQKYAT